MTKPTVARPRMCVAHCLLVMTGLLSVAAAREPTAPSSEVQHADGADDAIEQLNLAFREAYSDARETMLSKSGPIVLANGDGLVLLYQGRRIVGAPIARSYHDLKTVAHVPLAIYLCLAPCETGPLDDSQIARLRELREKIGAAENALGERFPDRRVRERQCSLLQRCAAFVDSVLEQGVASPDDLQQLLRDTLPPVQENIEQSVQIRIDGYRRQVLAWRRMIDPADWSRLRVVVQGAAMPRKDNLSVQFFAKLLGERGEGGRIVYTESLFDETQALRLLGTHLLDTQIGEDFFSDRWRMHRDLLGTAAAQYLDGVTLDEAPSHPRQE